jgi:hypothetical protein
MIAFRLSQTPRTKIEKDSRSERAAAERAKSYADFKARYRNDPEGFVLDCFEWKEGHGPTDYQLEILRNLPVKKRACVRGPHGLGKTALSAWLVLWFALTRDGEDWKMPTTAGAWRQLTKFLWPEIHKWARRINWDIVGRMPFDERLELQTLSLKLSTGEAFAVASNKPDLIEGAHADCLFYLYDESKAIGDDTFDAAEGAFSNAGEGTLNEAYAAAFSTPGEPQGRFYDIQSRKAGFEDWWARAVSLDEVIAAGRVARDWAAQRARQWGAESALYIRRVLGNFASDDESGVIPLSWIEAAQERWQEWVEAGKPGQLEALGIDVGGGGDPSVLAKLYRVNEPELMHIKRAVDTLEYENSGDPLAIGSIAARILNKFPALRTVVDVIGLGAGTASELRRSFSRILGFVAGGKVPTDARGNELTDKSGDLLFADARTWAWWTMREMLDPQYGEGWALPPDDRLTGDLTAPKWREWGKGRIKVESKDDIRKRLKRSTDAADAVIQTLYDEPEAPPRRKSQPSSGWRSLR